MKHCLVVDDSSSIRKVARRILEDMSFRTSEAETHAAAIDACRDEMPDCIVIDWWMPDGEDVEFLQALRRLPNGDKPTVVYLTSENDQMKVARARRCGADAHMMKPFDRESIARSFTSAGLI